MPDSPLVSILVPLYNAELYIEETIRYVLEQEYQNIELIIVDDSSTDHSYEKAAQYLSDPRVVLLKNPTKGGNAARNEAYRHSKGKYVMFLDADDYCSLGKIAAQVQSLERAPVGSVAFCTMRGFSRKGLSPQWARHIDHDYDKPVEILIDMWMYSGEHNCPHCYLVPREIVEKAGGWDESVLKNQDGEFFSRVIATSTKLVFTLNEYAAWRITKSGVSSKNTLETQRSQLYTYMKISSIILSYDSSMRARKVCASMLCVFAYQVYPKGRIFLPEIQKLLDSWNMPLVISHKGRCFDLLKRIFGWKIATIIVKNRFLKKLYQCVIHSQSV